MSGRGPGAKRCSRCGGILKDPRRKTHKKCVHGGGRQSSGERAQAVTVTLYPPQLRKLRAMGKNLSAEVRRLIEEA